MDEDIRTCGACKGKASMSAVHEVATDVRVTAMHVPLDTERVEGGARIYYSCACGNRFSFVSRLRRGRFIGSAVAGFAMAFFWSWGASGGQRHDGANDMATIFSLMSFMFGCIGLVATVVVLHDAWNRLRNPEWRGE